MAAALFLLFRAFVGQADAISSGSMEKSLLVGDYLMANNAIYGGEIPFTGIRTPAFREPAHGDIVVFRPDHNDPVLDVVKRVIGIPGDTLQMVERVVYRNGSPLQEPYVEPSPLGPRAGSAVRSDEGPGSPAPELFPLGFP